jgi:hypothetical protein
MFKLSRLTLVFVVATATSFAASGHSSSVKLYTDVHAGATSIPAGDYTLHWAADSGDTDLTISAGKLHYSIPVTVKRSPDKQTGNTGVLTHNDGTADVLDGFRIKDTLLMVR